MEILWKLPMVQRNTWSSFILNDLCPLTFNRTQVWCDSYKVCLVSRAIVLVNFALNVDSTTGLAIQSPSNQQTSVSPTGNQTTEKAPPKETQPKVTLEARVARGEAQVGPTVPIRQEQQANQTTTASVKQVFPPAGEEKRQESTPSPSLQRSASPSSGQEESKKAPETSANNNQSTVQQGAEHEKNSVTDCCRRRANCREDSRPTDTSGGRISCSWSTSSATRTECRERRTGVSSLPIHVRWWSRLARSIRQHYSSEWQHRSAANISSFSSRLGSELRRNTKRWLIHSSWIAHDHDERFITRKSRRL